MPQGLNLEINARGRLANLVLAPGMMLRVGTDAHCEIRLPADFRDVGNQGLTFECGDDRLVLYNHAARNTSLEGKPITAGRSAEWKPGQTLEIGPELRLTLTNRRMRRLATAASPASVANDQNDGAATASTEASAPSAGQGAFAPGDLARVGVIAVCMLASLALVLGSGGSEEQGVRLGLKDLIAAHQAAEVQSGPDPVRAAYCREIQAARIAALRGDGSRAREGLVRVRNSLLHRRRSDGRFGSDWEARAFELVRMMLRA